jgi:phenylpropionate dioxygenase-like ring-hydroxylating dioxygenase large terminal subunit
MNRSVFAAARQSISFLESWQPQFLESEARTFPAEMYTDPEIYRLEKRHIFGKAWCYVGHTSQLPEAGSYFTVEIAEQPLVILRNRAGELRAFFNICTHRGGAVAEGSGKCSYLKCMYHSWNFDLDGNLRGMPEMSEAKNFDASSHALLPVHVDIWGAFIFVNLDPDCEPLATFLGELPELFKRYQLDQLVRVHTQDYWTDVNWKIFEENTAESYHEMTVHPLSWCSQIDWGNTTVRAERNCYIQFQPYDVVAQGLASGLQAGLYIDTLNEQEMQTAVVACLFPNFTLIAGPDYCCTFLVDPQSVSKTRARLDWLVPNTPAATSPENIELVFKSFDAVMQEDLAMLPQVQKSLQSLGFRPGRLSPSREAGIHLFQAVVMQHLNQV